MLKYFKLPNGWYDILKWCVMIVLPAVATLLSALTSAWGWNIPIEAILKTFAAVETFLGAILGISTVAYNKEQK